MAAAVADFAVTFEPLGETTLLIRFGSRIDVQINAHVQEATAILRSARLPGVVDLVPAYASVALIYAPAAWADGDGMPWQNLADAVGSVFSAPPRHADVDGALVHIPVCYDGENAPDLDRVARIAGLDRAEVIALHTAPDYIVAMLGFAPGFPYLLGLDAALHAPRRMDPRLRVPRGSVAIGGEQTGIYPRELPGGWQLVGRTPLVLFDPWRATPCLLAAGDRVRFHAIAQHAFDVLEKDRSA
ncbi:MAG: 5-oxoprolinase subunit PxpB [Dokdonella sp.]|uniref:5-oxoprolinase subunit PxpB n=1 Tax=Dokdonella sp. TaxID=2291710 RepID=UPI003266F279